MGRLPKEKMCSELEAVNGGSGEDTLGMMVKQVASLGNKSFPSVDLEKCGGLLPIDYGDMHLVTEQEAGSREIVCCPARSLEEEAANDEAQPSKAVFNNVVNLFCVCSDFGSDVAKARRLAHVHAKDRPSDIILDVNCFLHQYQLLVAMLLRLLTWTLKCCKRSFKFWPALAKIAHSWRGKSGEIYEFLLAHADMGPLVAAAAKRLPPRPISGRWGSAFDCITYLLMFKASHRVAASAQSSRKMMMLFVLVITLAVWKNSQRRSG